jgi:hypothetical protein
MLKIALKYGVLIVLFSLIWIGLEYLVGMQADYVEFHPVLTLLTLLIPLMLIYFGIREAQKSATDYFTYADAFKTGFAITIVVAVLNPLLQWLCYTLAFPGFFETLQANSEAHQLSLGVDMEVARTQAMEQYSLGRYLWQSFIGTIVGGAVIAAIISLFVRDKALPKGG